MQPVHAGFQQFRPGLAQRGAVAVVVRLACRKERAVAVAAVLDQQDRRLRPGKTNFRRPEPVPIAPLRAERTRLAAPAKSSTCY
jgi:hypothetical protein